MLNTIRAELATIRERDPAARSSLEILLCYPGLHGPGHAPAEQAPLAS